MLLVLYSDVPSFALFLILLGEEQEQRQGLAAEKRFETVEFPLDEDVEKVVADFADSDSI